MRGQAAIPGLLDSVALVDKAIAVAKKGLVGNPSLSNDRALNRLILRLEAERSVLEAEIDAALAGSTSVQGPTEAQLKEVERLSAAAENALNRVVAVSMRIEITGKVVDLATDIVT